MSSTAENVSDAEVTFFIRSTVRDVLAAQHQLGRSTTADKRVANAIWDALITKYHFKRGAAALPARAKRKIACAVQRSRWFGGQRLTKDSTHWITTIVIEQLEQHFVVTPR